MGRERRGIRTVKMEVKWEGREKGGRKGDGGKWEVWGGRCW